MAGRALVTGGARRLGRAMALYLAGRGYAVAVHYATSSAEAETVAAEAKSLGVGAAALAADLLDETATEALVARAAEALGGPLTVLVNNASIFEYDSIFSATRESWDRHIGSNLRAPFVLTQRFAQECARADRSAGEPRASGLVVNMIDQRVLKPTPACLSYSLTKNALWAATKMLAQSLAPRIRVNAVGPGPTLANERQSREDFLRQTSSVLLGRGPLPEEIAQAVLFLAHAASVTGQMIAVDGGQHLAWRTPDAEAD